MVVPTGVVVCGRADGLHRTIERFRFERLSDSIGAPRRCALPVLWFGGEKPRRAYARSGRVRMLRVGLTARILLGIT
jgi:hypothetical protein